MHMLNISTGLSLLTSRTILGLLSLQILQNISHHRFLCIGVQGCDAGPELELQGLLVNESHSENDLEECVVHT